MNEEVRIKVLIVDDEPLACRKMKRLLQRDPSIEIFEALNGEEAIAILEKQDIDLLFLDVQMPGADGFDVLRSTKPGRVPHVIFVTAYNSYAIEAFEVHALDYLLKPFAQTRFFSALERAKQQIQRDRYQPDYQRMNALMQELQGKKSVLERIAVRQEGRVFLVPTKAIDWFEAADKYVIIHSGNANHTVRVSMKYLERNLDPKKFVRIHKSTIVNIERIKDMQVLFHGSYLIVLDTGTELRLSRSYKQCLEQALGQDLP